MQSSTFLGYNEQGHPLFDSKRTEAGEATYQLKYRGDWTQAKSLAQAIASHICPRLEKIGFVLPMPATKARPRQPVTEVANELGSLLEVPTFDGLLCKAPNGKSLKDLHHKAEKVDAIGDSLSVKDVITGDGPWNALLVDDLYDTGASMEAASIVLRTYAKIQRIYVAAFTCKG